MSTFSTFSKAIVAAAAGLVAALVFAGPASAGGVSAGGTGSLVAHGSGTAELKGAIGELVISGAGVLVVTDNGGDAAVRVWGHGAKRTVGNVTTYVGFNGRAKISGSKVTVRLVGVNVSLAGRGHGTFNLKGRGTYDTKPFAAGGEGVWTPVGATGDL